MDSDVLHIPAQEMLNVFTSILVKHGFPVEKALQCATIFTDSSIDGIYSHGVNRFPTFVDYVAKGHVLPAAEPSLKNAMGSIEQWEGNLGPGPLNAMMATHRAIGLARSSGIGCVALSNTNHWMRGGSYGWQAARGGCVFIGFTNTIANMPAWGAKDARLGNNPLVLAIPYQDEAIVLDMAMSQYSFGAMELARLKNTMLEVDGGFDANGNPTRDPGVIIDTRRTMPVGFWKGAGLALLLDMLAALLSGGLSTHEINKNAVEYGLSQVFIAIDLSRLGDSSIINKTIESILDDYKSSVLVESGRKVIYPGQRVLETRKANTIKGIPVQRRIWERVVML
ncbi:MAG: 3-dehydro-L-gulonate 2-dehydrogenase [Chitinophagaceae bacterium]|nr:3-dehydro-L-gulonate 2-dehydrogenase [Chitinophagaceae bacterium]